MLRKFILFSLMLFGSGCIGCACDPSREDDYADRYYYDAQQNEFFATSDWRGVDLEDLMPQNDLSAADDRHDASATPVTSPTTTCTAMPIGPSADCPEHRSPTVHL
jgi:hypothetical protein